MNLSSPVDWPEAFDDAWQIVSLRVRMRFAGLTTEERMDARNTLKAIGLRRARDSWRKRALTERKWANDFKDVGDKIAADLVAAESAAARRLEVLRRVFDGYGDAMDLDLRNDIARELETT